MRGGRLSPLRLWFSIVLLIAGVGVLVFANAEEIGFEARRVGIDLPGLTRAEAASGVSVSAETTSASGSAAGSGSGTDSGPRSAKTAWLAIPAIDVSVPIGTEQEAAMRRGAYIHAGSARPGETGNVVLAGHRRRDVFTLLHRVEKGDMIIVRWKSKTYRYKVAEKHRALPTDTKWLRRAGRDRITMYTCIPRFLGNKRTVVVAYPADAVSTP